MDAIGYHCIIQFVDSRSNVSIDDIIVKSYFCISRFMSCEQGSILSDVCAATCCGFCTSLQIYHELKHLGQLQLRAMA